MRSGGLRSAARAAARRGDWLSAARYYEALLLTGRARAGDRIQLGHARKELGDEEAALRAYADAAQRLPLHVDAQRQYGLYLRRLGRDAEALDVLARALALEPEAADIRAEIADMGVREAAALDRHFLHGILGGSDAARDEPGLITRLLAWLALRKARRYARARNWASAETHYRRVLHYAPNRSNARVQLGHALLEQERATEALSAYRRALLPHPREPDLYLHIGHALKALDRRDGALDAYLTAWRLKPGFASALDEIRGLRPDMDTAELLSGAMPASAGGREVSEVRPSDAHPRKLTPPASLTYRQEAIFKRLSGAISGKE